jgi:hypothetical protein
MSKSMQVQLVRVSDHKLASVTSNDCDPLNILIAIEESEDNEGLSGYGDSSVLVHHEPITFNK